MSCWTASTVLFVRAATSFSLSPSRRAKRKTSRAAQRPVETPLYLIVNGVHRQVAGVTGDELHKTICSSTHFVRKPAAMRGTVQDVGIDDLDLQMLERARQRLPHLECRRPGRRFGTLGDRPGRGPGAGGIGSSWTRRRRARRGHGGASGRGGEARIDRQGVGSH